MTQAASQKLGLLVYGVVLLWSSGFIVARLVGPYVEPFAFVAARNGGVVVVLVLIAAALSRAWPDRSAEWGHLFFAGALNQGVYLAAIYWAVREGLPAGVAALIGGFQPIAISLLALVVLGERIGPRRWLGIALGFLGAALVIAPRLEGIGPMVPLVPAAVCFVGILAIAIGTVWLKRHVRTVDVISGSAIQFAGAAAFAGLASVLFEHGIVIWSLPLIAGYIWAVFALGAGGMTIYFWLMNRGAMSAASSLLFLVPPTAALMAYVGFGEQLAPIQILGMAIAAVGVWLATRS